jgi:hypothetical protein
MEELNMLALVVRAQTALWRLRRRARSVGAEDGQTTTEYALVTLGAAAIALLVTAWAGRTGKIGDLMDAVVDRVLGRV